MKRILAWFGIIAIVLGFASLVYFTATGAPANVILATVFCMLIIPVIFYGFIFVTKLINDSHNNKE